MLSLVWKEARERLLWGVALVLISVYASWTHGYTFYGTAGPEMVNWSVGPILMAFLMGASSYTSELTARRAAFLLTRPVTWRGVLTSKLLVNIAMLLAAAALAAITYRFACPAEYRALATFPMLASGFYWAVIVTTLAYLVGLSCSSVVAGAAESAALAVVMGIVMIYSFSMGGSNSGVRWQVMLVLWPAALLAAGIGIARFGLTLPPRERLRRYLIGASAGIILLSVVLRLAPVPLVNRLISTRLSQERIRWSVSPDGRYAFGRDMRQLYWLDIRRDKLVRLENIYEDYSGLRVILEDVGWMAPHTPYRLGYAKDDWFIRTYLLDGDNVRHRDIPMGKLNDRSGYPGEMCVSPDGRIAAVSLSTGMDLPQTLVFADVAAGRRLKYQMTKAPGAPVWWEAAGVFHFTDLRGKATEKIF